MADDAGEMMRGALHEHLARWGLERFATEREYFVWQRQQLAPADLNLVAASADRKRSGGTREEIAFYNVAARPAILPVLYSQLYDYYEVVGLRVIPRFQGAKRILDFGCGAGILTTFFAGQCRDRHFVGVDRSAASIAIARQKADELGLTNVRFECLDVDTESLSEKYALIVSTHALVQHEQDPGIPSDSWRTFNRAWDAGRQAAFEQRTGLGVRLDRLCSVLEEQGRMVLLEKTRQLARRVPFQRALAGRGLWLVEPPEPIRYRLVGEVTDDGPLYHVQKGHAVPIAWDESPELEEDESFDPAVLRLPPGDARTPLYENHRPSAQLVWERLKARTVRAEMTRREPDGRELHVELGTADGMAYLYCANTFDQRQLVMFEPARAAQLDAYYSEIVS